MNSIYGQDTLLADVADGGPLGPDAVIPAHRRFVQRAMEQPDRPAVVCGTEVLTYGQLLHESAAVADTLRALNLGEEPVVGVCLPRRPQMLAAMLGVLMAGGTYLPLDPTYPLERRRFMLEHSEAAALLTMAAWAADLEGAVPAIVALDAESPRSRTSPPPSEEEDSAAIERLAYIMYTSGSTGRPKGVMVEQRGLAAFVDWGVATFSSEELSAVLASTSVGFDISLFELLVPLASGGSVVLVDNLFEFRGEEAEVTLVNTVPSLIAAFLRARDLPPSVRTVVLAGEPLSAGVADQVHQQSTVRRLVNAYGPTEDTIYSTFSEVVPGEAPLIGRPLPGTRAFVLENGHLAARAGAEGELYLAGAGLARGYRARDDLTHDRFVRDVPGSTDGEVMYRTGDLARWEADGRIRHLGRLDDQIKIRGVRIEPSEVETALLRHPSVRQAAAVARSREQGDRYLVGYLVVDDGVEIESQELRDLLRKILPEAMVPSLFVTIPQLPVTPNGKLDRKALPEVSVPSSGSVPETETEHRLAEIWRDVLGLERPPGSRDDFFELGGESLIALRLIDRIADEFGCELYPEVLVDASRLGDLAASIDAGVKVGRRRVTINPDGTRQPCIYIAAGAGGLLPLRSIGEALGPDQPLHGIPAYAERADRDKQALLSVTDTASDCLRLIRTLQPSGPYLLAGHSIGGHVAFDLACRLQAEGEQVAFLALLDPAAPHTLTTRGRLVSRTREVLGAGPEGRRAGFARAAIETALGPVKSRLSGPRSSVAEADDQEEDARWMRTLEGLESHYAPPRFRGDVTVYQTAGMARATGSHTLGWDRYVDGAVDTPRVGGGHNSMLTPPHVAALADDLSTRIDLVQRGLTSDRSNGRGAQGRVTAPPDAFRFGENWQRYVQGELTPERERIAEESLRALLDVPLEGKTFLDIGCGSGLFSLSAYRQGARRIVSLDVDPQSVAATRSLRATVGNPDNWEVLEGSILDDAFVASFEPADIVYSWGVLHHTGDMWHAIENASRLVAPGGLYCIAIYNKVEGRFLDSERWLQIKRRYNRSGRLTQFGMETAYLGYWGAAEVLRRKKNPFRSAREYKERRGMAVKIDLVDWLGGYPYEFATTDELLAFCEEKCGLERRRVIELDARDIGCHELVFEKPAQARAGQAAAN